MAEERISQGITTEKEDWESRYLQQRCISAVWRMLIWYLQKASREFMAP